MEAIAEYSARTCVPNMCVHCRLGSKSLSGFPHFSEIPRWAFMYMLQGWNRSRCTVRRLLTEQLTLPKHTPRDRERKSDSSHKKKTKNVFYSLLKHYLHSSRTTPQVPADRSEEDSSSSSTNTECLNKKRKSSWSKSEHEVYKSRCIQDRKVLYPYRLCY